MNPEVGLHSKFGVGCSKFDIQRKSESRKMNAER